MVAQATRPFGRKAGGVCIWRLGLARKRPKFPAPSMPIFDTPLARLVRIVTLGSMLSFAVDAAVADAITVFGSDQFPPVSYLADDKPQGVIPEILARLEKETGDRYDIQLVPWARAQKMAREGKGAVANISWNSERAEFFDYSVPIYLAEVVLVVRKGHEFPFETLDDLKGKRIGGGLGSSYRDEVDRAIAAGLFEVERDPNQSSRMRKLLAGRVDAIFVGTGRLGVKIMLESEPELKRLADQFVVLPKAVTSDPLYLAVPKTMNKRPLIARLNAAFTKLQAAGEFADLLPR